MALAPATRLGPYEILAPLGAGGMGEVYRARDTRLDRIVAIKILPAQVSNDPVRKQRFEREAKTVSSLNHPHICVLHDIGSQDGVDYLVMECVEGETLGKRLEKGPLPLEQVLRFGAEIADALDQAHRSGVVHRDLKPGNTMLTATGAKLLDFGLAKPAVPLAGPVTLTATKPELPATEEGVVVGTFQYMSPEQVEGKELDGRSDIFSLGALLYEMVTGKKAFEGKSQLSVASAILEKEPAPIRSIKPLTPAALDHAIRRCLAKNPEDRWQSARDVALELKFISPDSIAASEGVAVSPSRSRRELFAWAVAAAALIALGVHWFLRPRDSFSSLPTYSLIDPPASTSFQLEGDQGAPPVLSPDGSAVVFGARDQIWYHSLRTGAERALSGAHDAIFPFWSPDGSSIGFFADSKLKTLDISTGVMRTLCDAPSARGGAWSSSGIIVFSPGIRDVLYQVPALGGSPSAVTHLDPKLHTTHRWPFFLPDGEHFLYLASNSSFPQAEPNGIYLASLDGKVNRFLVSSIAGGIYAQGRLLFVKDYALYAQSLDLRRLALAGPVVRLADGIVVDGGIWHATITASQTNELIFQTGPGSALSRLEWVDRQGKHLNFASDKSEFLGPRLSRDARRILTGTGDPTVDTWVFDASGQNKSRLSFSGFITSEAVWSPDNSHFAVTAFLPNSRYRTFVKASSGSGPETVIHEADANEPVTDWSPDGRYLLAEHYLHGGSEIWLLPLAPDEAPRPLLPSLATKGSQFSGQFSPDGKFMSFTMAVASGPQVFIVPFPGGNGMWQASVDGGHWPRWRRDGKELYFVTLRNVVTAVAIHEKGESLEVGHAIPLFSFHPGRVYRLGMTGYDVAPDGQRFLLNAASDENNRPLTLLVNWQAELKK